MLPFGLGDDDDLPAFHRTGMEVRFVGGGATGPGRPRAWFRLRRPVVGDEEPTGVQRAAAAADFGNGVSWVLPFDGLDLPQPRPDAAPGPRRRRASGSGSTP